VKEALTHGQFLPWLKAEFGWNERTAYNLIAVAQTFGAKSEVIADLTIQPTVADFLAAPSVPDEARQVAVEKAEAGEQIALAEAKKIGAAAKKGKRRAKPIPVDKRGNRRRSTKAPSQSGDRHRPGTDRVGHQQRHPSRHPRLRGQPDPA
jgi:hypothetical protein